MKRAPSRVRCAVGSAASSGPTAGPFFSTRSRARAPAVQEKILRVVEYGELERLGAGATTHVDVRVIGATNRDLPDEADEGRFRHDLLDRLAFEVVTVPPVRARGDDIVLLAEHFARAMAFEIGWPDFPGFSRAARDALMGYEWPGNVREIRNVVERAVCRWNDAGAPVGELDFDPFASAYRPRRADGGGEGPSPGAPSEEPAPPSTPERVLSLRPRPHGRGLRKAPARRCFGDAALQPARDVPPPAAQLSPTPQPPAQARVDLSSPVRCAASPRNRALPRAEAPPAGPASRRNRSRRRRRRARRTASGTPAT